MSLPLGGHLRANGIRQHYLHAAGPGDAILIVPGIASPAALWGFVARHLSEDFDTHVLDVRGRGLSEAGPELDYGLDTLADDVAAFVAARGLKRVTLLGHSMGARIAIRAGRRHPSAAARLLLVDPPVSGPGRRPYPSPLAALLPLIEAARRGEGEAALRAPGVAPWPEEHLRTRAEWMHSCDPRAVTIAHGGFQTDDIHADLPHLVMPVGLIGAGRGGVITDEDAQEMQELLPGLLFRRLEGAGHQMQVDDTAGFLTLVRRMLAAL